MYILTINAGSSSIKYKAFQVEKQQVTPLLSGLIEGIGESECLWHHYKHSKETIKKNFKAHDESFHSLADKLHHDLKDHPITGVGHRVVHGGERYYEPTVITPQILKEIKELAHLAPIHNPINALGIEFAQQYFPEAQHIAVFDSGFHHTMPEYIRQYAIDSAIANRYQIKRYGFHGINHEYVANQAATYLQKPIKDCNFITLHLGNGASACLIKQGKSFDTSMGMTPLAGLVMGTRCGDIDPAIPLYLQQQGMTAQQVDIFLNKQSGLKGIAGENDMRRLIANALAGDQSAELAIEMYVYAIQKTIGAYSSQVAALDGLIFTGGVGENAALIRERIVAPLKHLDFELDSTANSSCSNEKCQIISNSGKPILVVRGDEEAYIAQKAATKILENQHQSKS